MDTIKRVQNSEFEGRIKEHEIKLRLLLSSLCNAWNEFTQDMFLVFHSQFLHFYLPSVAHDEV